MSDLDIIIFAIAGVAIILISLYVVMAMTQDINETICKCNEIGTWAKTNWKGEAMSNFVKPTGGCIKCAKSKFIRTGYFCGNKKLTDKQLFNKKGYCSNFVPMPERRTDGQRTGD